MTFSVHNDLSKGIEAVLRILIRIRRIRRFLGHLDPDQDPSITKEKQEENLNSYCFVTSFRLFIFVGILKVIDENRRIQIRILTRIRIRGMDPRIQIRIHTKMSWIRNTGLKKYNCNIPTKIIYYENVRRIELQNYSYNNLQHNGIKIDIVHN